MNQHCGKHDKIFNENNPCPGCENEKQGIAVSSASESLAMAADVAKVAEDVAKVEIKNEAQNVESRISEIISSFEDKLRSAFRG